jgi:AcrR family transcriptional regulator
MSAVEESLTETLARRAIERTVAERQAGYVEDIRKIVDATYRVIERSGGFDPTLRDILQESGLSTQAFYRHFRSKDELLLILLDDGRRRLLGYLSHRMGKQSSPAGKVRAWIEGVLAQAAHPEAARRTRPFVANQDRLAEQFPAEQQKSVDLLVDLLAGAIERFPGQGKRTARRDAQVVYNATFGALHKHLTHQTRPAAAEVDHLVGFTLNAVGSGGGRR